MAFDWILGQRLLQTFCELLSLACSLYMVLLCILKLDRKKLMVQQLLSLACSDLSRSFWCYVLPCLEYGTPLWPGCPVWCGPWQFVARWIQLQSVLFSACIGLGVLAALVRCRQAILLLHLAPLVVPPLAAVLCIAYIIKPAQAISPRSDSIPLPYCRAWPMANRLFALEVSFVFVSTVPIFVLAIRRLRKVAPSGVVARSIWVAMRYVGAFVCSYGLYVGSQISEFSKPNNEHSSRWWGLHVARDQLYILYAFMTFLALAAERRGKAASRQRVATGVAFRSTISEHRRSQVTSAASFISGSSCTRDREEDEDSEDDDLWFLLGICNNGEDEGPEMGSSCRTSQEPTEVGSSLAVVTSGPPL